MNDGKFSHRYDNFNCCSTDERGFFPRLATAANFVCLCSIDRLDPMAFTFLLKQAKFIVLVNIFFVAFFRQEKLM